MDSEHNPHAPSVLVQSVLLVLLVLCSSAIAQQPSIRHYESEEDLWEALNDGEIAFDEFTELLDLARSGADSLLTPPSDWEALPGSEAGYLVVPDSTQPLTQPPWLPASRVDIPWVSSVRMGIDADLNKPTGSDGYTVVRFQHGDWRSVFDFEHDRDDGGIWRRRSLIWQPKNYSIVLGSFEPRWGRGLVVGRRSRVISGSEVSGDFWQPTRGRFNGIWLATPSNRQISGQLLYSEIRGEEFIDRAVAARLEARLSSHRVGITGLVGGNLYNRSAIPQTVTRIDGHPRLGGMDYHHAFRRGAILAEIAMDRDGATGKTAELLWRLSHGRFHARMWSYGSSFVSEWGGGPGHGDTRIVDLDQTDETFASRTAGERGFDFTTRVAAAPNVNLRWDWMSHREEPGAKLEHSGVFRVEVKRLTFRTSPFVRAQIDEDETESCSLGNYLWWGPDGRELNLRTEFGTHYDDEVQFVRLGLGAKVQINRVVRFAPAVRWNDPNLDTPSDGYWYLYFTETVLPIDGARIEMALVWKKYEASAKDDLVELRVRGFVR